MSPRGRAIVLLSGGLDSATTLAIARADGFDACTLTFRYGQRHESELRSARKVAESLGAERQILAEIDLRSLGHSALTSDLEVPRNRTVQTMGEGIPITYVPARNTIFLSYALAWAEVLQADDIFIGVNAVDYSGYPDCRPEYVEAFEAMANLATRAAVQDGRRLTIHAPLLHLSKAQIIARGLELGVDYSLTSSCYDPSTDGEACGACDACTLRLAGFRDAGIPDPVRYRPPDARPAASS